MDTGNDKKIRLNKYLAEAGVCSRREADRLIAAGDVTVDGETAVPGQSVTGTERILAGGRIVRGRDRKIVVAWYKPQGVTTTHSDPHAKVTVDDAFKFPVRLTYAGRLDRDSEGLLLMTNDGDLINAMMRAGAGHEKEYIVRTRAKISDAQLHQMEKGVWLKDLQVKTRPCRIERLGDYSFRIVLTQGLNRQIRRMCASVGADIKVLKRVRVLCVTVKGLKPGMYRELNTQEKEQLYKEAFGNG